MKIYKTNQQSLLIKTFGIKDTIYLATTVLVYFDLNDPDHPLKEQELWSEIPAQLGPKPVLDLGQPKPRGEVLVTGHCHAPRGQTRPAGRVSVRVGGWNKTLNVFGHRHWIGASEMSRQISKAEPFSAMPITWENAFGGKGFDRNPQGKGSAPLVTPQGTNIHPLPNVEYPDRLIGDQTDRPDPASFGPVDMMWPPRSQKVGTYDKKWQQERWPFFPDDINYEYFNTASEDQFLPDFFKGGESIQIVGMHPDMQVIDSHVPRLRVRCFVTRKKSLKSVDQDDLVFQEIKTHMDTVWLFPDLLRGVAMFRGTTNVLDDEYEDVVRIFLANEVLDDPPETIEHYFEAQKKALDMTVPIDQTPLAEAKEKIATALKRIKQIPKEIEAAKQKAMGNAPKMPPQSPGEMAARSKAVVNDGRALLGRLEAQAREMQAKWGHMAAIPLDKFDFLRSKMDQADRKIDQTVEKIQKAIAQGDQAKKEMGDRLKANLSPEDLAKSGVDPDNLIPVKSVNPWHDHGFPFVVQCRRDLEKDRDAFNKLFRLGFTRHTISKAWLGINHEERTESAADWGLESENGPPAESRPLILPAGLVAPHFNGAVLDRIAITPGNLDDSSNGQFVEGSDETPLFLPAVEDEAPIVRVSTELEAFLIEQEAGDAVGVVVLKTPAEKPGKEAATGLEKAPVVLIVLKPEDAENRTVMKTWTDAFPNARALVLPPSQNIFQARQKGTDLRRWIMEALPPNYARQHNVDIALPKPGQPPSGSPLEGLAFPKMDLKTMITQAVNEAMAAYQPLKDKLLAEQSALEGKAREMAAQAGQDPEAIMTAAKARPRPSPVEATRDMAQKITAEKDRLRQMGRLTPDVEASLDESLAQVKKLEQMSEKHLADFEIKKKELEAAKVKAKAGELPEKAKEKLLAAGIDPDRIKKRTREEVIEMHGRGESLAGAILSGLDLSGLDLSKADFTQSQCRKTNFTGANLEGAIFTRTLGREADFSGASLAGAVLEKGLFQKAKFIGADLGRANLYQAVMTDADLTETDLSGARLDWVVMQRAKLVKAVMKGVQVEMGVFSDADVTEADFSDAVFHKSLFKGTKLDRAVFSGARFDSTMLQRVTGAAVNFSGANLDRIRIIGGSKLAGADFRACSMNHAYLKECDLSGARFQGVVMQKAMMESCDLSKAGFQGMEAQESRLNKCNLEGANLIGINLFQGSLKKTRLVKTDLRLSNLYGVDFYKAVFGQTALEQADLKATQIEGRTEFLK